MIDIEDKTRKKVNVSDLKSGDVFICDNHRVYMSMRWVRIQPPDDFDGYQGLFKNAIDLSTGALVYIQLGTMVDKVNATLTVY